VKPIILILLALSSTAGADCLPVAGSRILGRDLAAAEPGLADLPKTITIAFSPTPGTKRIFSVAELGRIARANAIPFEPAADICFEIPLKAPSGDEAVTAMRRALPPDTEFKLIELQRVSLPAGPLEFPAAGLQAMAPGGAPGVEGTQLWRGFVRFAETQKAPLWARVLVVRSKAGAGSAGPPTRPGDTIRVEVDCGRTHLAVDAIAVAAAHTGDIIVLRNPDTGKIFKARLIAPSQARLVLSPGQTL
jgi:hypothetical protein